MIKKQVFMYHVENFCAVNKFRLGGVAVGLGGVALALHCVQRGIYEAGINKSFKNAL